MDFKIQPYKHQLQALDMSKKLTDLGLLWEMGTGKTGGMINILRHKFNEAGRLRKTLVLSPLVTLFNWKEEFMMHSNIREQDIIVLHKGGGAGKTKALVQRVEDDKGMLTIPKIAITNYESLQNQAFYDTVQEWQPDILVMDEAHLVKNPSAKRSKKVFAIAKKAENRYILTGTPILNNIQDIFMQFKCLDLGATFGLNFYTFRNTYMEDVNRQWNNKANHFPDYKPIESKYDELTSKIYTKCYRVTKDQCLDLPPLISEKRIVELGPEQKKYYKQMERDFVAFVEEKQKDKSLAGAVVAQLAVTKAIRLQQIVSGYAVTDTGEEINIQKNPRLDACRELVEELVPSHKVIIWCSFKNNYKQLGNMLEEMGVKHVFITGDQNLEQKKGAMDAFQNDQDVRVVVANRRAAGIGINLTSASYSIIYSRNFSLGEELQSEARNHRGGSQIHQRIVKIDLIGRDTIDEKVVEALRNKQDISKRIVDLVKK